MKSEKNSSLNRANNTAKAFKQKWAWCFGPKWMTDK